ncbi:unnamed protein product [Closterium sp. Naga37s-1]|nr:unnamed protein product [Closterium sp. Naga37s-1]
MSASATDGLPCARIMHVREVVSAGQSIAGMLVRVTGRIRPIAGGDETRIRIEGRSGALLVVDTSRIVTPGMRPNSLFQFLGKVDWREDAAEEDKMLLANSAGGFEASPTSFTFLLCPRLPLQVLLAQLGRSVEGMDEGLFERALELKRQFESAARAAR